LTALQTAAPATRPSSALNEGTNDSAGATVPVSTARAERKAVPLTIPAVGTAEVISSVDIRAQATGQLRAIHFAEGDEVRQGRPLFSLDPRSFQAALQQAQAVLARDTATLQNAQADRTRLETLLQRGPIPREQYESQHASATALAATLRRTRP
jgi:multidrug efflux system membrane fusion protein